MVLRTLSALVFAGLALAAAFVFAAAASADMALALTQQARMNDALAVRIQLYQRAAQTLEQSWARPLSWHAGALETASAIALFRAEDADEAARTPLLAESRDYAVLALRHAPNQPNALIRLALLEHYGVANDYCEAQACLSRSLEIAPLLPPEVDCVRLGLGLKLNMIEVSDPRLLRIARVAGARRASQCLGDYMAPEQLFELLLRARTGDSR